MRTRVIATGLLLLISSVAFAHRPPGPPPGFDIDKLEILLELDGYQKAEVQKVLDAQRATMHAKREELRASQTPPSFEQMQQERQAAQQATRAQLAKLLSEEQLRKFDVLNEHPRMHARRGKGERQN